MPPTNTDLEASIRHGVTGTPNDMLTFPTNIHTPNAALVLVYWDQE
jgi:hypothetical protein